MTKMSQIYTNNYFINNVGKKPLDREGILNLKKHIEFWLNNKINDGFHAGAFGFEYVEKQKLRYYKTLEVMRQHGY